MRREGAVLVLRALADLGDGWRHAALARAQHATHAELRAGGALALVGAAHHCDVLVHLAVAANV